MKLLLVVAAIFLFGVASVVRCEEEAIEVTEPQNDNIVNDVLDNEEPVEQDEDEYEDEEVEDEGAEEDEEFADPAVYQKVYKTVTYSKPVMVSSHVVTHHTSSQVVTHISSSSSSSSKCVPSGFIKAGCWADKAARAVPDMDKYVGGGNYQARKDAINKCYKMAAKKGLTVFAIQHGGWCAAGKSLAAAKKYGKSTACKDGKGGPWANSVYIVKCAPAIATYTSIGCWADKAARAVPNMDKYVGGGNYQARKDAIKKCFNMAAKKGLNVFAIQHGGWCAAGNDLAAAKKYGKSTACKDGKGGPWANSVYIIRRGQLRG